ncbi:MAG: aldehyde dehydrogenase family protein, partial [Pseudomonadota bacterium]
MAQQYGYEALLAQVDHHARQFGIEGRFSVTNPATGETIAEIPDWSADQVETAIEAARQAMPAWQEKTAQQRADALMVWYDLILLNKSALAALLTAEQGKPIREAEGEIAYAASFIKWFAEEGKRAYGEVVPTNAPTRRLIVLKQPIGVVAAITPWNFPSAMITRKVAPALSAGCPIIVKPAEDTPLSALALEMLAHAAGLPVDLFRVVPTSDPVSIGDILTGSSVIRKLSFTGSTATGKILMRACANTVKKVSLELGGNAPFIVFESADLDAAADGAILSKFRNAGQTCVCANRILVQASIKEAFIERLIERTKQLKIGHGAEAGTDIGPLINTAAIGKVSGLVQTSVN